MKVKEIVCHGGSCSSLSETVGVKDRREGRGAGYAGLYQQDKNNYQLNSYCFFRKRRFQNKNMEVYNSMYVTGASFNSIIFSILYDIQGVPKMHDSK